jgi:hypothetical protein
MKSILLLSLLLNLLPLTLCSLAVALHAQLAPGNKVVGSVLTTDGLKSALMVRDDISQAEVFYPYHYDGFMGTVWDLVIIEGWFPGMNEFLILARNQLPSHALILFYCLDANYPGIDVIKKFDVDAYITNSRSLVKNLGNIWRHQLSC